MLNKKYFIHENKIAKVLNTKSIVKDYEIEHDIIDYHVTYGNHVINHVVLTYFNNKLIKVSGTIMISDINDLMVIE